MTVEILSVHGLKCTIDDSSEVAFEASEGFSLGLALGHLALEIELRGLVDAEPR
jgi:hypothetical protein